MNTLKTEPDGSALAQIAATALQGRVSKRVRMALTAYTLGTLGYQHGSKIWKRLKDRNRYWVTVNATDEVYDELHEWLLDRIPEKNRRSVIARSKPKNRMELISPEGENPRDPERVRLFYDSNAPQTVEIGGHLIEVAVVKPDWAARIGPNAGDWMRDMAKEEERMVFTCADVHAHNAVLSFLADLVSAHDEIRTPKLRIANRWGGWSNRNDLPLRQLDTVILQGDQRATLISDLRRFLDAEAVYSSMGIPWHRGYLFHGPPGTGKTSLARALATEFGLDVWYIPLSDLDKDTKLLGLVAEVTPGSILLLEDIDTLAAATDREDTPFGISAAGLLNSLDGVATPHGLITVMTTNHRDKLDPALIRPGRVDLQLPVGYLTGAQLVAMFEKFTDTTIKVPWTSSAIESRHLTPADVVDVLKSHIEDPATAAEAVIALIESRVATEG